MPSDQPTSPLLEAADAVGHAAADVVSLTADVQQVRQQVTEISLATTLSLFGRLKTDLQAAFNWAEDEWAQIEALFAAHTTPAPAVLEPVSTAEPVTEPPATPSSTETP